MIVLCPCFYTQLSCIIVVGMGTKTRIGILGIGGVGGFIGGKLALKYTGSATTEIIFIARGATEKVLKENGLKLIIEEKEIVVRPDLVSSDPAVIGHLDVLICCTKSYHLEESLKPLGACIDDTSIVMPLLNGVDATPRIRAMYPMAQVLDACIYVVSLITEPGVVKVQDNSHAVYFGGRTNDYPRLEFLQELMLGAKISSYLFVQIESIVWEKFIFISAIGGMTCYVDQPIGEILASPSHSQMLMDMLNESFAVARANHIVFDKDAHERVVKKIRKLPYETTSSMYRDFKKGGKTEYLSLIEFIVVQGDKFDIDTPVYDQVLKIFTGQKTGTV
jgi:2-dehydropantoate 2-reductase